MSIFEITFLPTLKRSGNKIRKGPATAVQFISRNSLVTIFKPIARSNGSSDAKRFHSFSSE